MLFFEDDVYVCFSDCVSVLYAFHFMQQLGTAIYIYIYNIYHNNIKYIYIYIYIYKYKIIIAIIDI